MFRVGAAVLACGLAWAGAAMPANASSFEILHRFEVRGINSGDGAMPLASLVDVDGILYGTTYNGGNNKYYDCQPSVYPGVLSTCGTAFSINLATHAETVLHSFAIVINNDGGNPETGLTPFAGALYGTTEFGGSLGGGTVFSIDPSTGAEQVVLSFPGEMGSGSAPQAGLIRVGGKLYGTTAYGTTPGCGRCLGSIFSFDPATGALTILHTFAGNGDGRFPLASLIDAGGILYGTTQNGGTFGRGTVFSLDLTTGAERVLHSFGAGSDGAFPDASLVDIDGTLYGTTYSGGQSSGRCSGLRRSYGYCGTIFSIDSATGVETVVHSFRGGRYGATPTAGLTNLHGRLYGTTSLGGDKGSYCYLGCGTIFSLDPKTGSVRREYSFREEDGYSPAANLVAVGGTLYGTASAGGPHNAGTVFAFTP